MFQNKCIVTCPENYNSNENNICISTESNKCKYEYFTISLSINELPNEVDKIGKNYNEYYSGITNQVTLKGQNQIYYCNL